MKAPQPAHDWKLGMLHARVRFWRTQPKAEALVTRIEAEIEKATGAAAEPQAQRVANNNPQKASAA